MAVFSFHISQTPQPIDHLLIETSLDSAVLLKSGCLCCTLRGDLVDTLTNLFDRRQRGELPAFRRVLIETTGLADPAPILHALMADPAVTAHYRMDHVITTVDAVNALGQLAGHYESAKQAAVADRLVLTKSDLASQTDIAAVTDRACKSPNGGPALLFEKPAGFDIPVASNVFGSLERMCLALGVRTLDDLAAEINQLMTPQMPEGIVDALKMLDGGRISIAALGVGIAQGAYEAALKYSKQRKQFGRPISEFQAIQHKLADMATSIEAARLLTYQAGYMKDADRRVTKESAMAKLFQKAFCLR